MADTSVGPRSSHLHVATQVLQTALANAHLQQLQAHGDPGEHVVEVVGNAAGQLAGGLHLLALAQPFLHRHQFVSPGLHPLFKRCGHLLQTLLSHAAIGDAGGCTEPLADVAFAGHQRDCPHLDPADGAVWQQGAVFYLQRRRQLRGMSNGQFHRGPVLGVHQLLTPVAPSGLELGHVPLAINLLLLPIGGD
ncbi:hypothetical protein G6F66_013935 [Rhizopus arrhizus]|nr:hypothetical protein G6F66_013935 [Rhizopus arrhizus]